MKGEIKIKRKGLVRTPQLYEAICEMLIDSGVLQIDWKDEDAETRIYRWELKDQESLIGIHKTADAVTFVSVGDEKRYYTAICLPKKQKSV